MIKRIKLPGWIVIFLLLFGMISGVNKTVSAILAKSSETEVETNIRKESEDLSVYPGLNIKTKTEEADHYTLSVSQPYTDHEQVDEPINQWIEQQTKAFMLEVEDAETTLIENDFRAHLTVQVETEEVADKLYTLELQANQVMDELSETITVNSFVVDLNQNKHLELEDIFQLDEKVIADLQIQIEKQLYNDEEIAPHLVGDRLARILEDPNKWKWSINQDKMIFYFDPHEIAADEAGLIEVEILLDRIKLYLDEEFVKQIGVVIEEEKDEPKKKQKPNESAKLDPNGKYVALTFDDGPHPEVTPRILETLRVHNAQATFFMLGTQVQYYPSLAKEVQKAGHEIGDHTMYHRDLTTLGIHQIQEEFQQSNNAIKHATGIDPTFFRPPYGALNNDVHQAVSNLDRELVMWSVDSLDWKSRNAAAINEQVMSQVAPGAIVLLHDIHDTTADALPQLLTSLKAQGYEMVTVSQLFELWEETGVHKPF